jgi:hypothetical protein
MFATNIVAYCLLDFYRQKREKARTTMLSADSEERPALRAGCRLATEYELNKPDRTRRTYFGSIGCDVYGWPSSGGVIIRHQADAIEMQCLGLDHLEPPLTRSKDQDEEDAFCLRLLNIGGKWWSSEHRSRLIWRQLNGMTSIIEDETEEEMREIWVGWPKSGGILLSVFQSEMGHIRTPEDMGRLRMALTMEERCELLRTRFGAVYYEHAEDYAGFSAQHAKISRAIPVL